MRRAALLLLWLPACLLSEQDAPRYAGELCLELGCPEDMGAVLVDQAHQLGAGALRVEGARCVCVDRWEASRGTGGAARSEAGELPWVGLDVDQAAAACAAAGKRLCTPREWSAACSGVPARRFPYGDVLDPERCPPASGVRATGAAITCQGSTAELHDLSGNAAEWARDETCDERAGCAAFGGSFASPEHELACGYRGGYARTATAGDVGFRCCQGG